MTNEIERMILDKYKEKIKMEYEKLVAYNLFKQIWDAILNEEEWNFTFNENSNENKEIKIKFNLKVYDKKFFINESYGICFLVLGDNYAFQYNTFFRNYTKEKNFLNNNVDLKLLLDLLKCDNFDYEIEDEDNNLWINLKVDKKNINKIINGTLLKNKRLIKSRGQYDRIYK